MDLHLTNKTALITGGTGEIGSAAVRALAAEGAQLLIGYHTDRMGAEALAAQVSTGPAKARAVRAPLDGSHPDLPDGVDILIANAVSWPTAADDDHEAVVEALATNVAGTIATVEAVLPSMRRRGWGRILIVSTDLVDQPMPGPLSYPASKGALEAAARVLAAREASHGILTNTLRPGFTMSARAAAMPGAVESESARTPTGRICTPDDVATAIAFLASAANAHINGETISVGGGRHLTR